MKKNRGAAFEEKTYRRLVKTARAFLKIAFDIEVHGRENIPQSGGFILASNHLSFFDPVMLCAFCERTCFFMAKSELFEKPFLGPFIRKMNAFPVKRGTSDKAALGFAERVIEQGKVLGIFPEGKRTEDFKPIKPKNGVAYLAKKARADVLPVSIHRNKGEIFRPDVVIRFGRPIAFESLGLDGEYKAHKIREAAKTIMDSIVELWEIDEKRKTQNEN